jgi:F0F1-type ATP synthase membrane subunit c/vacuolar-type H+-ATPase subunit K
MPLREALLYAAAPAAAGYALALILIFLAVRDFTLDAESKPRAMIFAAVPASAVMIALVAAMQTAELDPLPRVPLMTLGAAAFLCTAAQGFVASRGLPRVLKDPTRLGRALLPLAALEVLVILPFLWVMISLPASA